MCCREKEKESARAIFRLLLFLLGYLAGVPFAFSDCTGDTREKSVAFCDRFATGKPVTVSWESLKNIIFHLFSVLSSGIRLVGGSWNGEGRVEIFYNGNWGTVCDDRWDIREARVVCRQLGFYDALSAPKSANFGTGRGPIWLDDMNCGGNENSIKKCWHRGWGEGNCDHNQDASVICSSK